MSAAGTQMRTQTMRRFQLSGGSLCGEPFGSVKRSHEAAEILQ
jgi:hypothetical protein